MDAREQQLWAICRDLEADASAREEARQRLLEGHLPLVRYTVARLSISFPSSVVEHSDLFQAGVIGLMDAYERFDPTLGIDFSTFATRRIRGSVLDELRALDWIPRSVRQKGQAVAQVCARLSLELLRPPSDEEVAQAMELSPEAYEAMMARIRVPPVHSLEDLLDTEKGALSQAPATPDDQEAAAAAREQMEILARGIEGLGERERTVLTLYYYEELTLKEIARVLDLTESRVCQIHAGAILKLRGFQLRSMGLPEPEPKPKRPRKSAETLPAQGAWQAENGRPGPP